MSRGHQIKSSATELAGNMVEPAARTPCRPCRAQRFAVRTSLTAYDRGHWPGLRADLWVAGDIDGSNGDSLKVHLAGDKAGIWCEFYQVDDRYIDKETLLDDYPLKQVNVDHIRSVYYDRDSRDCTLRNLVSRFQCRSRKQNTLSSIAFARIRPRDATVQ